MCLLANEALVMIAAYIWLETYKCTLTLICLYVIMMLVAGYFRSKTQYLCPCGTIRCPTSHSTYMPSRSYLASNGSGMLTSNAAVGFDRE